MGGHNFYPFYTTLYVISLFLYQVSQGISRYLKVSQGISKKNKSKGRSRYPKVPKGISKVYQGKSKGVQRYIQRYPKVYQRSIKGISKGIQRYIKVSQGITRYLKVLKEKPIQR